MCWLTFTSTNIIAITIIANLKRKQELMGRGRQKWPANPIPMVEAVLSVELAKVLLTVFKFNKNKKWTKMKKKSVHLLARYK